MSSDDIQIEEFQKQIRENPQDILACYNLGDTLQGIGRNDEAMDAYNKALKLDVNRDYTAIVHYNLGTFHYNNNRIEEAIKEFEHTIQDLPKLKAKEDIRSDIAMKAHNNLGSALLSKTQRKESYYSEEDDLEKAEENFRKALEIDSTYYSAKKNLEVVREMIAGGWNVYDEKTGAIIKFFAGKSKTNNEIPISMPKKSRSQLLAEPKISCVVNRLHRFLLLDNTSPDNMHFICSLYVIGSYTNLDECNDYSDIDLVVLIPLSLFKDINIHQQIIHLLQDIEREVIKTYETGSDIHLWPKPIEWYENIRPFMKGDLSDFLWLYKHKDERENYYSSSTPYDLLALDGWSGLASDTLLHYEKATAVLLEGKDVFKEMKLPETIHRHEWFELALVASRDLSIGFSKRADGWKSVHQGKLDGEKLIKRGENLIGKAVLRMFYAKELLETGRPINTYKGIRDWALERYSLDDRMTELADNAYRAKVLLERTLLCSTANLMPFVLANPEITAVAPIANLFSSTIGMKEHFIYSRKGYIHVPFKPGVREFYWERTLPNLVRSLADRDINPMILTVFIPEIRDYLNRDLSYLKEKGITEDQIYDVDTIENVIGILERCAWFYLGYDPKTGGSVYDLFQICGSYEKDRIKKTVVDILYTNNQLIAHVLNRSNPEWLEEKIVQTIDTLAGTLAMYGTKLTALVGNELVQKSYILYGKMVSIINSDRFVVKYSDLCYEYMLNLGRILKINVNISNEKHAISQIEKSISWYQKATRLNPNREDAYFYLGDMYMTFGMPQQAKECFTKALQVSPASSRALALFVDVHELTSLIKDKSDAIKKCKELEKKNSAAKLGLVKLTFPKWLNENDAQKWLDKNLGDDWDKVIDLFRFWPPELMMALSNRINSDHIIKKESNVTKK